MATRSDLSVASLREQAMDWVLDTTFLSNVSPEEQDGVLALAEWRTWEAGEVILEEGRVGAMVLLIVQGKAEIGRRDERGAFVEMNSAGPGSVIGEMSVARNTPTSAEVTALSAVRAIVIPRDPFRHLLAGSAAVREAIDQLIALRDATPELLELLARNPLFRMFSRADTERFVAAGKIKRAEANERIIAAGSRDRDVYVLLRGRIAVYAPGKREILASEGPGWVFGHAAALLNTRRTAEVEALEPSELLMVGANALMEITAHAPAAERKMIEELVGMGVARMPLSIRSMHSGGRRMVVLEKGRNVETRALSYGIAAELAADTRVVVVEIDEPRTSHVVMRDDVEGETPVRRGRVPGYENLEVVAVSEHSRIAPVLDRLRAQAAHVVVQASVDDPSHQELVPGADYVIQVRGATEPPWSAPPRVGQRLIDVVRIAKGARATAAQVRVPSDRSTAEEFRRSGDPSVLTSESALGRGARRVARVLRGRSVGLALAGGGAMGFAHVGLIRVLHRAGIPIDFISGSSFGSLVSGLYAAGGLDALEELVVRRYACLAAIGGAMVSTSALEKWINSLIGPTELGETEVPFLPVALDLLSGRQVVLARGTVAQGIRASSSMPGPCSSWKHGSWHLVDGALINNVPVSVLWDAGAHFIIGSNVTPGFTRAKAAPSIWQRVRQPFLGRMEEYMQSMYLMARQASRDRMRLADSVFEIVLEDCGMLDVHRGDAIALQGERKAEREIAHIVATYAGTRPRVDANGPSGRDAPS